LENFSRSPKTKDSLNPTRRLRTTITTTSHASNAISKVISNLNVLYLRKHVGEKKGKKDKKQKKAYIAWEDNASTTSDSLSDEEIQNVCLMAKSMDDSSTIAETEVNPEFEEVFGSI